MDNRTSEEIARSFELANKIRKMKIDEKLVELMENRTPEEIIRHYEVANNGRSIIFNENLVNKRLLIRGLVPILLLLFFAFLNPSINQFKEFTAQPEKFYQNKSDERRERNPFTIVRRRTQNFLLFSFFELGMVDSYGNYISKSRYIGFCFNFFEIGISKVNEGAINESIKIDDTAIIVDTTRN